MCAYSSDFHDLYNGKTIYYDVVSHQSKILSVAAPPDTAQQYSGVIKIREEIIYGGAAYTVRRINSDAFQNNTQITDINLPGTLDTLFLDRFKGCSNLKSLALRYDNGVTLNDLVFVPASDDINTKIDSLYLDRDVYVEFGDADEENPPFYYANALKNVTFGSHITHLPSQFFAGTQIRSLSLPSNLKELDERAFAEMNTLVSFTAEQLNYIPESAFEGCIALDSVVIKLARNIEANAFADCVKLKSITLPSNLLSIQDKAFLRCSSLDSIVLPNSVTSIGNYVFQQCGNLIKVVMPEALTSMGTQVFWTCTKLSDINIPPRLTTIPVLTFSHCYSLKSLTIPDNIKEIGNLAFRACRSMKSITIPASVNKIGAQCFFMTDSLKTFVLADGEGVLDFSASNDVDKQIFAQSGVDSVYLGRLVVGHDYYERTSQQPGYLCSPFRQLTSLRAVCFGPVYKKLPEALLYGCSNLTKVDIHSNLEEIENNVFYGCTSLKEFTMPSSVTQIGKGAFKGMAFEKIVLSDSITDIPENAFSDCVNLKSVNMPANLKSIGASAFNGCRSLTSIVIPESVDTIYTRAFKGCSSLHKVTIEPSVNPLGVFVSSTGTNQVFSGCMLDTVFVGRNLSYPVQLESNLFSNADSKLNYVEIGDSVTSLQPMFFVHCANVKTVRLGKGLKELPYRAFDGCSSLKEVTTDKIETMGEMAFNNCVSLDSIDISSVSKIEKYVFQKCTSLKNVVTSEKLTAIGNSAFLSSGIDKFEFAPSLKEVGSYAFSNTKVRDVVIPDNVTKMGEMVFGNCTALNSIEFPATMTVIPSLVCYNSPNLSSIVMPSTVDTISNGAFSGCTALSEVNLSSELKVIGESSFSECVNLNEIKFPSKVSEIGSSAFYKCTNLKRLDIPNNIKNINSLAFANCTSLTKIEIFESDDTLSIYSVPDNSVQALYGGAVAKEYESANQPFYGCRIDSMILHRHVSFTSDTVSAFEFLKHLVYLEIDTTVKYIPPYTFRHCDKLDYIRVLSEVPPVLGMKNFRDRHVYVPDSSILRYCQTEYWKDNIIVGAQKGIDTICVEVLPSRSLRMAIAELGVNLATVSALKVSGKLGPDDWNVLMSELTNLSYFDGSELENTEIPDSIFANNTKVNAVVLPGNVEDIGSNSFDNSGIRHISFSGRLVRICRKAYLGVNILSVDLPASLRVIEDSAFAKCEDLLDVYTHTLTPLPMPDSVFASCNFDTIVLHVPYGTRDLYANAPGWNVFKNIVEDQVGVDLPFDPNEQATKVEEAIADEKSTTIDVYTFDGKYVTSIKTDVSTATKTLPAGRYLLKSKGKVYKVLKNN
ncbi:MAG: leucine-rich repeat protein [Bacteroidaceae bacterium]|nr:leucine-rich repeat protein [Bacteroidaceae bacterium]